MRHNPEAYMCTLKEEARSWREERRQKSCFVTRFPFSYLTIKKSGRKDYHLSPIYIINIPLYFDTHLPLDETVMRFCTTYVRYSVLTSIIIFFCVCHIHCKKKVTLIWFLYDRHKFFRHITARDSRYIETCFLGKENRRMKSKYTPKQIQ